MTRYRIRIYRSPGQQHVLTRQFRAANDTIAELTARRIVAYVHHRKRISAYVTSWALDALRIDPIKWETVATS